jgi:peptidoglycan/LPS O-acetylase OafA/YrhL
MSYREQPGYVDMLLVLRGLASLGVLVVHCLNTGDLSIGAYRLAHLQGEGWPAWLAGVLLPSTGVNFVLFFFVHSGYLIGKVFFTDRYSLDEAGILRFYRGRFLRLAPLLWFHMVVLLALGLNERPEPLRMLGEALFIGNFTGEAVNGVTWSLSYEMQFYLVAPFIVIWVKAGTARALAGLLLAALAFWVVFVLDRALGGIDLRDVLPFEYMGFFLFGLAVNLVIRRNPRPLPRHAPLFGLVVGFFGGHLAYHALSQSGWEVAGQLALALLGAMAIALVEWPRRPRAVAAEPAGRQLFGRFWTWLGMLSYGVYLWHSPIRFAQEQPLTSLAREVADATGIGSALGRVVVYHALQLPTVIGFSVALSYLTFMLVERRYRPNLYDTALARAVSPHARMTLVADAVGRALRPLARLAQPQATGERPEPQADGLDAKPAIAARKRRP